MDDFPTFLIGCTQLELISNLIKQNMDDSSKIQKHSFVSCEKAIHQVSFKVYFFIQSYLGAFECEKIFIKIRKGKIRYFWFFVSLAHFSMN